MVGQVGVRNFLLDFTDHEASGMRREQQLDDAQTRFGSHGGEHVSVSGHFLCRVSASAQSLYFDICRNINRREENFKIGLLYSVFFALMTPLTIFGLFAVTAMLVFYALEKKGSWFILAFAGSCLLGSAYGFLQGAWPFGLVEAVWAVVAARRWWSVRSSHKRD